MKSSERGILDYTLQSPNLPLSLSALFNKQSEANVWDLTDRNQNPTVTQRQTLKFHISQLGSDSLNSTILHLHRDLNINMICHKYASQQFLYALMYSSSISVELFISIFLHLFPD